MLPSTSAIVDLTLDSNNLETEPSIVMQPDLDELHNAPQGFNERVSLSWIPQPSSNWLDDTNLEQLLLSSLWLRISLYKQACWKFDIGMLSNKSLSREGSRYYKYSEGSSVHCDPRYESGRVRYTPPAERRQ